MSGFEKVCVTRQDNQLMISWQGEDLGTVQVYQAFVPDVSADEVWALRSKTATPQRCSLISGRIFC